MNDRNERRKRYRAELAKRELDAAIDTAQRHIVKACREWRGKADHNVRLASRIDPDHRAEFEADRDRRAKELGDWIEDLFADRAS